MVQSVVLFAKDPGVANSLIGALRSHFQAVVVANSEQELHHTLARTQAEAVVLDIELSRLNDVAILRRAYPLLPIVCTHRIPDEELWVSAIEAGASDVCASDDVANVLSSVLRNMASAQETAA